MPIPVAARSNASICGRSLAGIAGANLVDDMGVLSCECCVLSGRRFYNRWISCPEKSYRTWCLERQPNREKTANLFITLFEEILWNMLLFILHTNHFIIVSLPSFGQHMNWIQFFLTAKERHFWDPDVDVMMLKWYLNKYRKFWHSSGQLIT
jgi:hypothetical protein